MARTESQTHLNLENLLKLDTDVSNDVCSVILEQTLIQVVNV